MKGSWKEDAAKPNAAGEQKLCATAPPRDQFDQLQLKRFPPSDGHWTSFSVGVTRPNMCSGAGCCQEYFPANQRMIGIFNLH